MNKHIYPLSESLDLIVNIASMSPAEKAKHLHVKLGDILCMDENEDAILRDVGNNFALKICFRVDEDDTYLGMIQLNRTLAKIFNLPLGGMADAALAAAEAAAPATFQGLHSFMLDSRRGIFPESPLLSEVRKEDVDPFEIYILSSTIRTYGASALYYPGVQEKISKLVGGSYYVLPCSVHEVLILPDINSSGGLDAGSLSSIVKLVNDQELQESDLLSYRVLYYDDKIRALCETSPETGAKACRL